MKKRTILPGYLLVIAAISFWLSWFLMPDQGTTDTHHILEIVKQSRLAVLYSVIVQITSSVLFMTSLFLLATVSSPCRQTMIGFILFGIGAMGFCADAFFHLLAYFMTDVTVNIQQDVLQVMRYMQTKGVILLVPLMLPFFIGSIVSAVGLNKQAVISKNPSLILVAAFSMGILSAVAGKTHLFNGSLLRLSALGLFAAAHLLIGIELIRTGKAKCPGEAALREHYYSNIN